MNKRGTSSGLAMPPGLSKIVGISVYGSCAIVFSVMPTTVYAIQNRLGTSLIVQQDQDDNYLMSSTKQKTLAGLYLKPSINYSHDKGFEKFSVNLQGSIERYNLSEYNVSNPASEINYQRVMERATLNLGYNASRQSTKISDGVVNGFTNQQANTTTAAWQYQLTEKNLFSLNGSMQTIDYESNIYADLKNNGFQASWQSELTNRLGFYTVLSQSKYDSSYNGSFFIVPQLIQGYVLCPPNSLWISEATCTMARGDAVNAITSSGLQGGFKWDIREQLKFSLNAGVTYIDTLQTIKIPEVSVQYGEPIDQEVVFGGRRSNRSESKLVTTDMSFTYQLEASTFNFTLSRNIRPSSTASLLRIDALSFSMRKGLSDVDWIEANFLIENLQTIDDKIINTSAVDRNIFRGTIKYGYRFSPTLVASASIGYRYQEANESTTIKANALLGALAISYTPREWSW